MRLCIVGAGGVGGYLGARLVKSGCELSFVELGAHAQAITQHGLTIRSPHGDTIVGPVPTYGRLREAGAFDVVLVCVKTFQLDEAIVGLAAAVREASIVVPLLNGLDAPGRLAQLGLAATIVGGACKTLSEIVEPGVIHQQLPRAHVVLEEPPRQATEAVHWLQQRLLQAGITVERTNTLRAALWGKLAVTVPMGTIGAVLGAPVGAWRDVAEHRAVARSILDELEAVAHADGHPPPEGLADRTLAIYDRLAPQCTTSLQRDLAAGRPSELGALTGAALRIAHAHGVEVPTLRRLYEQLATIHGGQCA